MQEGEKDHPPQEQEEDATTSCSERLLKKDDTIFRDYIEHTTVHGVVRIFSGRSILRRLFWLLIVLASVAGCLYNCIDRIQFLASRPTATTASVSRVQPIDFPAVTFCNLNLVAASSFNDNDTRDLVSLLFNVDPSSPGELQECEQLVGSVPPELDSVPLEGFGNHPLKTFLQNCTFLGVVCKEDDFEPVQTSLGQCYTFNSGRRKPILQTPSTGVRFGLSVFIDIEQSEYLASVSADAGVRVVVHPQSVPPTPLDQGVSVPPGRNAFISVTQRNMVDNTGYNCRMQTDLSGFNYLQGEYNYSGSACVLDCLHTQLAENCSCSFSPDQFPPDTPAVSDLPRCQLSDICCVFNETARPSACSCPTACVSTDYITSTSYSSLPANYITDSLEDLFGVLHVENVLADIVGVNVYFETLNVETFTTNSAYSVVALLSDIGGQLGLFLGISVISMMEFGTWLLDEFKDRCLWCKFTSNRRKNSPEKMELPPV